MVSQAIGEGGVLVQASQACGGPLGDIMAGAACAVVASTEGSAAIVVYFMGTSSIEYWVTA